MLADMYTPVSVYMRMRYRGVQSALMECSDYHDRSSSRSFVATHPIGSIAIGHGVATFSLPGGSVLRRNIDDNYTCDVAINEFMQRFDISGEHSDVFGLFGYTTFNAVRYFEHINVKDETQKENDAPDILYIMYRDIVVIDHFNSRMTLVTLGGSDALDAMKQSLDSAVDQDYGFRAVGECTSPLTDDEHRANIRRGIQHCLRGDVFQVVISRRFIQHFEGDDFKLYRTLRSINPSPYLFYFDFGGFRIFGSSPETHCRIENRKAYIDPIAGTTRRTGDADADRRAAEFLRKDPKENAEHVMLVDLARNDLSRNCHDVKVDFYKDLQYYSHVVHLVSRVSGQLDEGADAVKAFIDTFPAGTLSGAPKVRAMQIISELEPHNRGAYGGCVGFIGLNGNLNQAITIRTFVSRGGELWFQAGGGIVAKSNVEYELQEVNKYENSDQMARLFDLEESGYFYSRLQNPTNDAVAAKIAALEGGVAAMLTSSGMAAVFFAAFNICEAGGHFLSACNIYGGAYNLFGVTMKKMGVDCTFFDPDKLTDDEVKALIQPNTKFIFGETISNPGGAVFDIERYAKIAHEAGVPLIIDNTFATPVNCRPIEWGADIVVHSTTKYMDGHASCVGGVIVDSGNFDWLAHADKFPGLCLPDESYHGLTYAKDFGKFAYITKATAQLMRDLGSCQSPQDAYVLNIGLESLHVRMRQHCENAQKVAEWLQTRPEVGWIHFAGLPTDKYYPLYQKYLPKGGCGVIAFGLKGTREEAVKFMDSLKMINIVTHVADVKTCVLHPASHTHRQLSDEQLREAGIAPDLVRLSIGIEDASDIIADLAQALDALQQSK